MFMGETVFKIAGGRTPLVKGLGTKTLGKEGRRLQFDMKYYILHVFRTTAPFKEKFFDYFKYVHKLKLLTNFYFNLTTSLGEVQ